MDLMEYKAKELYQKYRIPSMKGIVIENMEELSGDIGGLKFPVVIKAQVQVGGRGKAGGIKFADNMQELKEACSSILGMNIKGHTVKKLLITEKTDISKECYLSIILDRAKKGPMVIYSPMGGVDIEETAREFPDKVLKISIDPLTGIRDYVTRYIVSKTGLDMALYDQLADLLKKLYTLFCEYECTLVEVNPLVITEDNKLIALDGKISTDDSALYRQPDIIEFRNSLQENELVKKARGYNFLYIPCDEEGTIAVMSNGSGMLMSCIDLISKQGMSVGAVLDLGGGATAERIKEAIRIMFSDRRIKALFINIFGGITRCDEVASGVRQAVEEYVRDKTIIVRFEGTNKAKGLKILEAINDNVIFVNGLQEGVMELHKRREQL